MLIEETGISELINRYKEEIKRLQDINNKLVEENKKLYAECLPRKTYDDMATAIFLQREFEEFDKLKNQINTD
jgi:hypothetical protein